MTKSKTAKPGDVNWEVNPIPYAVPSDVTINHSGINPLDLRVLVKPDPVDDKIGSIIIPDAERERRQMAECRALLVAVGENAFTEVAGKKPQPGDRVLLAKYAGIVTKGDDGEEYRLCNDADICAVLG